MKIDYPAREQIPKLRELWQEAFADDDTFLDTFYSIAFAPDRCRCVTVDGVLSAALYWFDCSLNGKPVAYIYAVATKQSCRGKGIGRALMENTHSHLAYLGYAGAVLVPATEALFRMYEGFGYRTCCMISEFVSAAAEEPAAFRAIDGEEFRILRRRYLSAGSVLQEGVGLEFLQTMAKFYAGEDFLLTVADTDGAFFAPELLGNVHAAPSVLTAFGKKEGTFRTPGGDKPYAMYKTLRDPEIPRYFCFAFD